MKIVIYENEIGQRIVFDNKFLFCESIDMTGTAGIHAVENLAFANGQQSVYHKLSAKTIPCSFAFYETDDEYTKRLAETIFNPEISGTLTVFTPTHKYQIECRPQNIPVFKHDEIISVHRFDVDFTSDFSYWKMDSELSVPLTSTTTSLRSVNPVHLPVRIYFPANEKYRIFQINSKGFRLKPCTFPLWIDTENFKITDNSGNNCNQYIDPENNVDEVFLRYGNNTIVCSPCNGEILYYYQLSAGEM